MKKRKSEVVALEGSCRRAGDTLLAIGNVTAESLETIEGPKIRVNELVFNNPVYPIFLQKHVLICPYCKDMFYKGILDRIGRSRLDRKK